MANTLATTLEQVSNANIESQFPVMIKDNWKQLDQGSTNNDEPIAPLYSDSYAKKKGFKIPDLKDTGDFRNSFDIDFRPNAKEPLVWGASDEKAEFLWDKYSFDVMGLNQENAEKNANVIQTKTNRYIDRIVTRTL